MTDTLNRYGSLCAEIYDLDKPVGSLFDIPYYSGRLKDLDGPILEAGVGTGRLYVPLLEAGLDIAGFDHSPDMLAVCRRNAQDRGLTPKLSQARFQDFAFDQAFAAIIVPTSSFMLVDDFDDALAVLERFRAALAPGGRLLADLPPLSFFEAPGGVPSWTAANGDLLRMRSERVVTDPVGQRRVNHDTYERWRDGRLIDSQLELFAYRVWGWKEFEMALAVAGFTDIEVSANYRPGRSPKPADGILNFAARAPD
ncbi:MAG: class I SAM-dependent methyltransferase [Pseudomonadota bacterium]